MKEEERTALLTEAMRFERRTPVSAAEKAACVGLEAACSDALNALRKLHLRVWHAAQGDYRSLPMDEARKELTEVQEKIDVALEKCR